MGFERGAFVLLLTTEIWRSHGGIQRYNRVIARILGDSSEPFGVLTLLDADSDRPAEEASLAVVCCAGNKLTFCWQALRVTIRTRPRVAIVGHVGLLPIAWALRQLGLIDRYAVVLHGIEAWGRLSWLSRVAARKATAVIATTRYTAREFCFHNDLEKLKCAVIPLASSFRDPPFHPRTVTSGCKMLVVTRLSFADVYKGLDTLLLAVRYGRDQGWNLTLDVIGDGNDKKRLEDLACSWNIQGAVHFRGSVSDEELEGALRECHVFALPSKKEGFGIVYLEAMAAGLPCIGANHGGTPEVIEHGETGFLIEYGDAEQLAFYLRALMESPGLYAAMSEAARRRATETLTIKTMADSWESLLQRLGGESTIELQSFDEEPGRAKLPPLVS
jgi:glycosyltransferase involved in cell wall biosynthesis